MPEDTRRVNAQMSAIIRLVDSNADALIARRNQELSSRSTGEKVADGIATFAGSVTFLYIHVAWFGFWILVNTGKVGLPSFDPFPYGLLTMVVSLEAIFLSTFLLISANRLAKTAEEKADLDLHINLLAEHEISRVLRLVDAIAEKMGIEEAFDPEVEGLEQDTRIDDLLTEIGARGS
jgi:uncharacterized membrane protein